ncbi:hypothetical protein HU200_040844 [Digitaria exilis]|uniref:Knottins-like domain-containing protein n=1 Tax=Digitaria exilis TaxID=1010633 RepID=A0A835BFS6_9POAL|nr:hypothetical protein HU200_040844 [Digitaria exilis]
MKPSWMNLSVVSFVAVLLLIFLVGDMVRVDASCSHLSANYKGWCTSTHSCRTTCTREDENNGDGNCSDTVPARCWCIKKNCSVSEEAAPDEGGTGVAAASGDGQVKRGREFPVLV